MCAFINILGGVSKYLVLGRTRSEGPCGLEQRPPLTPKIP